MLCLSRRSSPSDSRRSCPGPAQAPGAGPQGPKVQLTFERRRLVTLVANGATLREILAEWSRQGGSTFVNAERLDWRAADASVPSTSRKRK